MNVFSFTVNVVGKVNFRPTTLLRNISNTRLSTLLAFPSPRPFKRQVTDEPR